MKTKATLVAVLAATMLAGCSSSTGSTAAHGTSASPATSAPVVQPAARGVEGACYWVTAGEAADILGGPVTLEPLLDEAGSVEMSCGYRQSIDSTIESDLKLPGAFPVDAASQFALGTAPATNVTTVDGLGVKAACVTEPQTTPPSTTLLVLLTGDRLYRATGTYYPSCDSLKRFAKTAIARIGT